MVTEQYDRRRPYPGRAFGGPALAGVAGPLLLTGLLAGLPSGLLAGCSGGGDDGVTSAQPGATTRPTGAGALPGDAVASPAVSGAAAAAASALPGAQGQKVPAATVVQLLERSLEGRLGAVVHTSISGRIGVEGAPGRTGVGTLTGTRDNLITQVKISEEGRSMTVLSTPKALYLKGLMQVQGKVWAKTTAAGNKQSASTVGGVYSAVTEIADPRNLPETWRGLDTSTVTGPTSVKGVPVKSYRARLRPDDAFALMPTELRTPQLRAAFQKLTSVQTLSIDAAGHPVQVVTRVTGSVTADGRPQTIDQLTSVRYSDWGRATTITVPTSATAFELTTATGIK